MAAVIIGARVAAAHEGVAELIVVLRHANGGVSEVALDQPSAAALLAGCRVDRPEDLAGYGWEHVRDALTASWNGPVGNTGEPSNNGSERSKRTCSI